MAAHSHLRPFIKDLIDEILHNVVALFDRPGTRNEHVELKKLSVPGLSGAHRMERQVVIGVGGKEIADSRVVFFGQGDIEQGSTRLSHEFGPGDKDIDPYREGDDRVEPCLLYTSPSPRDKRQSRMPSSA